MRCACVVVLYHPTQSEILNLKKYIHVFDCLYIMDNSNVSSEKEIKKLLIYGNFLYEFYGDNKGLAYALCDACDKAILDGYDYIMTMDQDSIIEETAIQSIMKYMDKYKVALIAPSVYPIFEGDSFDKLANNKEDLPIQCVESNFAITSGSLIDLKMYQKVGGFDKELFIEFIDVDFCVKLKNNDEKIIVLQNVPLYQRAGNSVEKKLLWKSIHPLFANPIRGYYLARNYIYLLKKYGWNVTKITSPLCFSIIKTILFEDCKIIRMKYYLKGLYSGVKGNMRPLVKKYGVERK